MPARHGFLRLLKYLCSRTPNEDDPRFLLMTTWTLSALSIAEHLLLDIQTVIRIIGVPYRGFLLFETPRLGLMPELMTRSTTIQPICHFQRSFHLQKRLEGRKLSRNKHRLLEIG